MLSRHVGAGPLAEPAAQVLALSKMDWNTDALYSSLPASLAYAQVLARIVKTEALPPVPFDYRLLCRAERSARRSPAWATPC